MGLASTNTPKTFVLGHCLKKQALMLAKIWFYFDTINVINVPNWLKFSRKLGTEMGLTSPHTLKFFLFEGFFRK